MNDPDLHDALGRLVESQPPPLRSGDLLAAGRRARRRRSLLAGTGTAAAVVAAVVAGTAVADLGRAGGSTSPASAPTAAAQPTVPGVSPGQARRIVSDCLDAFETARKVKVPRESARLYNAALTPWGTGYMIYGPKLYVSCLDPTDGQGDGLRVNGNAEQQTTWLPGQLVVDWSIADGMPGGQPAVYTVEGRVGPSVVRVKVGYGSKKITVPAVNGTFKAALRFPAAEMASGRPSLVGYNAGGETVNPEAPGIRRDPLNECWVTPAGVPIYQRVPGSGVECKPAVRWR